MKVLVIIFALFLTACGGNEVSPRDTRPPPAPRLEPQGDFQKADADHDGSLNYREYGVYSDLKAGIDEDEKRAREQEFDEGNFALQKRFMVLDRNNNGQLSLMEVGGG